jgi:hypothetical protein
MAHDRAEWAGGEAAGYGDIWMVADYGTRSVQVNLNVLRTGISTTGLSPGLYAAKRRISAGFVRFACYGRLPR